VCSSDPPSRRTRARKRSATKRAITGLAKAAGEMATQHYDLLVIGGGSGGLAASKNAAKLGKKVAVCDFVKPSPAGTTWGLGGTCVNVGCIPKKLMHQTALLGEAMKDAKEYGWDVPEVPKHKWEDMVNAVQMHIKSLNFGYRAELMSESVKYFNTYATFTDPHTVKAVDKKGKETIITADQFILAMGGRPKYPDVPGAKEHCITSDDIFAMRTPPGKTLVVGASYVALECAGFIHGVGFETKVMMRSIPLRGFDQQMAGQIKTYMEEIGIPFIEGAVPSSIEKVGEKKKVTWQYKDGTTASEEFDTVMFATGRDVCTTGIGLEAAGVKLSANGKIPVANEQTNVPHIFAIGDIIDGDALSPPSALTELTPVAIQAGKLLAKRLYDGATMQMDYTNVPTTVYTPLEYGCVGMTEEDAEGKHGKDNIEVYHSYFKPLEWTIPHKGDNACYAKLICDLKDNERVLGLHICGPNAGEMTQGFAVAIKLGATKADFDNTVGIHPTVVEEFTTMHVTKRGGGSAEKTGC